MEPQTISKANTQLKLMGPLRSTHQVPSAFDYFLSTYFLLALIKKPRSSIKPPRVFHKLACPKILFSTEAMNPGLARDKVPRTLGEFLKLLRVSVGNGTHLTCPPRSLHCSVNYFVDTALDAGSAQQNSEICFLLCFFSCGPQVISLKLLD